MAWSDQDGWATYLLGPHLPAVVIALVIAISLPVLLHQFLYRQKAPTQLPTFLVLGPSGAGKTSLVAHLETGQNVPTRPSQAPTSVTATLPASASQASAKYRAAADPSLSQRPKIRVIDTPGHPKLRPHSLISPSTTSSLSNPSAGTTGTSKIALKQPADGLIFVVDATTLNSGEDTDSQGEAAEYLHDLLLTLQRRYENAKSSRAKEVPILIAAAKDDLFTAVPASLARKTLERELGRVRVARARGLLGVEADADGATEEGGLGGSTDGEFTFKAMEEFGIRVDVLGGNVKEGESGVKRWWEWIGGCL